MSHTFDEKELLERVDNDWDFLGETVRMLADDGPELLKDIRQAAEAGDAPGVGRAAHTLKGMISNFCATDAHAGALAVEQIGKGGDLSALSPALQALETQLSGLIADLNVFVGTRSRCGS
jgi:HPt (histidine-containing phosphotransfer) domain-containing protein